MRFRDSRRPVMKFLMYGIYPERFSKAYGDGWFAGLDAKGSSRRARNNSCSPRLDIAPVVSTPASNPTCRRLTTRRLRAKQRPPQKLCRNPIIAAVVPTPGATGCPYTSI